MSARLVSVVLRAWIVALLLGGVCLAAAAQPAERSAAGSGAGIAEASGEGSGSAVAEESSGREGSGSALVVDPLWSPGPTPAGDDERVTLDWQARAAEGATCAAVRVVCSAPVCSSARRVRALESLLAVRAGDPLTTEAIRQSSVRMLETGLFANVDAVVLDGAAGPELELRPTNAVLVRHLRVRTRNALASELRRRVFLRPGSVWSEDARLISRQRQVLAEYFEQRGWFDSSIAVSVEPRPALSALDLELDVDRGRRRAVNNIYLLGLRALDYEEARALAFGEFDLVRTFTTRRFERAQTAIVNRLRTAGYLQARVTLDEARVGEGGLVDLFVEVREGARWRVEFEGNREFGDSDLLRRLTFYRTGLIDQAEIDLSTREIASLYETRGHFFATIEVRDEGVDEQGDRVLVVRIDEGPASALRDIRFVGNEALEESELRGVVSSRVYDVLSPGGYLQRSVVDADVRAIEGLYRQRGYLQARVVRTVAQRGDSAGDVFLTFEIDEGAPTRARSVVVADDAASGLDASHARLEPGAIVTRRQLDADVARLGARARDGGRERAQVAVRCELDGVDVPCDQAPTASACVASLDTHRAHVCRRGLRGGFLAEECVLLRSDPGCERPAGSPDVDVVFDVGELRDASFGEVFVRGAFRTRRSAIRREFLFDTGDPFDADELLAAQSGLRSLGIFDAVRVNPLWYVDAETGEETAAVVVHLEEARTRSFDHRIGLEARIATLGDALLVVANEPSYRDSNFLGRAEELRVSGNFDIDVVDVGRVADEEFRAGVSVVLFDPRFWLWGLIDDAWEARNELSWRYDLLAQAPSPLRRSIEFSSRVREEFRAIRGLSFELGVSLRRTRTADQSIGVEEARVFEPALIVALSPRVTLDRRDNPLNPTRGYFTQLEIEVADDFFGVLDSRRYTRFVTRASGWLPFGSRLVLGGTVRFGAATGGIFDGLRASGPNALPLSERFSLGGVTSLRGFPEGAVSPAGTTQFGGDVVLNGTVELRYPFLPSLGLDGAIFVDWGELARDVGDLAPSDVRASTGFGVRWLIAGIVPLVLDYGAVLARRPGEALGRLHFNIGYTF